MNKLKRVLKDLNITQQEIADELGIKSLSTVNLKLNSKYDFSTTEASKLKNLINSKSDTQYSIEELFSNVDKE